TGAQAADAPDNSVHVPVIADANGKTEWYDYHLRQANDPAGLCLDDGISIDPASIYILKGATKTTELTLIAPTPGNPNPTSTNVPAAAPKNGGPPIPKDKLSAKFRIANWGSTEGSAFGDESLWATLGTTTNGADIPAGTPQAPTSAELKFTWTANATDPLLAKFFTNPPQRTAHQCMLVELDSPDAAFFFVNRSTFQNMRLVK